MGLIGLCLLRDILLGVWVGDHQVFTWDVLEGLAVQVVCYFEGGWS